jgi:hypothetical protein
VWTSKRSRVAGPCHELGVIIVSSGQVDIAEPLSEPVEGNCDVSILLRADSDDDVAETERYAGHGYSAPPWSTAIARPVRRDGLDFARPVAMTLHFGALRFIRCVIVASTSPSGFARVEHRPGCGSC